MMDNALVSGKPCTQLLVKYAFTCNIQGFRLSLKEIEILPFLGGP